VRSSYKKERGYLRWETGKNAKVKKGCHTSRWGELGEKAFGQAEGKKNPRGSKKNRERVLQKGKGAPPPQKIDLQGRVQRDQSNKGKNEITKREGDT